MCTSCGIVLTMSLKLYLAGPEVFLPHPREKAEEQILLCKKYGFTPLHPSDNSIDLGNFDYSTATRIYRGDVEQVRSCDVVVANCNPFRSPCLIDDGTAYELGFGNALGKVSYGYIAKRELLTERTIRGCSTTPWKEDPRYHIDKDGYLVTDAFETTINLMMECGMSESGGRLVEGTFEDCLIAIRKDQDSGKVSM